MSTESKDVAVASCLCGQGSVNEHFWANDYAFASDYAWHPSGPQLHCETCAQNWVITTIVANPVEPPQGQSVVYFVSLGEAEKVRTHNDEVAQKSRLLFGTISELEADLKGRVRALQVELTSKANSAGVGVAAKFDAVGKSLGFKSLDDFRAAVGRTRPATYIEQLVTLRSLTTVLRNLGRNSEASVVREIREKLRHNSQEYESLKAESLAPTASHHRFYEAP